MDTQRSFCEQLVRLNGTMKELFLSGNVMLFPEMNAAIKELYALQHASDEVWAQAVGPDCAVIYGNFDMIVKVLNTTEDGVIDLGAQKAIDRFLHNIDKAVINIARTFGLI